MHKKNKNILTLLTSSFNFTKTRKLKQLRLRSNHFNLDFELCAKFAKHSWRIGEVNICYLPRTFKEGRKMRPLTGGLGALWTIIRERLSFT